MMMVRRIYHGFMALALLERNIGPLQWGMGEGGGRRKKREREKVQGDAVAK